HETVLGKPVGSDLREGKVTLPLIYALDRATADERAQVETILRDGHYETVPFEIVLTLIRNYSGVERAMERAGAFTGKARKLIDEFPDGPAQRALLALTDLITGRDH
ncbi:MAG: polyprenyl synthetase family protein, partial [Fimbriimonadales bacterium]